MATFLTLLSRAGSLVWRLGTSGVSKLKTIINWSYYYGAKAFNYVANNFWTIVDWIGRGVAVDQIINYIKQFM